MEQKAEQPKTPSTKNRFLGLLKQPTASNYYSPSPLDELDEGDVFWSSYPSTDPDPPAPETTIIPPNNNHLRHPTSPLSGASSSSGSPHPFKPSPSSTGLSAALSDTPQSQLIQRKTAALNPSASAAVSIFPQSNASNFRSDGGFPVVGSYYGRKKKFHQSAPVNVPVWPASLKGRRAGDQAAFLSAFDEDAEQLDDGGEMIPPHEIVARSDQRTTFSVFEGVGRTLKGRDLTKVRNAVMQKTGFID